MQQAPRNQPGSKKGRAGEAVAATFLEKKGMRILKRNFRSRFGEVDIIALDGETVVFAEVKTWAILGIDALEQALSTRKKHKIIETSKFFLSLHREYRYMAIRFDVIFISPKWPERTQRPQGSQWPEGTQIITHLASAFTEGV